MKLFPSITVDFDQTPLLNLQGHFPLINLVLTEEARSKVLETLCSSIEDTDG